MSIHTTQHSCRTGTGGDNSDPKASRGTTVFMGGWARGQGWVKHQMTSDWKLACSVTFNSSSDVCNSESNFSLKWLDERGFWMSKNKERMRGPKCEILASMVL